MKEGGTGYINQGDQRSLLEVLLGTGHPSETSGSILKLLQAEDIVVSPVPNMIHHYGRIVAIYGWRIRRVYRIGLRDNYQRGFLRKRQNFSVPPGW